MSQSILALFLAAILLTTAISGCSGNRVTSSSSLLETPIEIDEAVQAIRESGIVDKVWSEKGRIRFEGKGFSGELFHGTEGEPFQRYGMDVSFSLWTDQEEILQVLDRLTERLHPQVSGDPLEDE